MLERIKTKIRIKKYGKAKTSLMETGFARNVPEDVVKMMNHTYGVQIVSCNSNGTFNIKCDRWVNC